MSRLSIKDKVVVVTGATGVLGGSIIEYIASEGSKVAVLARNKTLVDEKANDLISKGYQAIGVQADVTKKEELIKAKEIILKKWSAVDVIINAAGGNTKAAVIQPEDSIFEMDMDAFDQVMKLNLHGTILPTLVFGPTIAKNKGSVINISSVAAHSALTRVSGYSAAKAAVENFTKWIASELALRYPERIRVNAVAPGFFIAKQNQSLLLKKDGSFTERGKQIINRTPMRRFGKPEEIHGAIHFLISDSASFVTGTVLSVDGGYGAYSGI